MKRLLFGFITVFLISGCGFNKDVAESNNNNKQNLIHVKNSTIQNVDRESGQEISKHLVSLASRIPNVNDATAVVLGRYAIVGIDVKQNLDRTDVGSIKYSVAESLKNDPHGARAIVIADPDINARLKEISKDIENGKPVQGILNELSDIAGRLIPEIPADMIEPNKKDPTEESNSKLKGSNEKELENKQQEQSNHQKD